MSQIATLGLSCRTCIRRYHCHSAVNVIIHRALAAAHVPSRLEPSGLYRSDGKRPDGVSIVPWKCGQLLVWDATCPDTFAPSYSALLHNKLEQLLNSLKKRRLKYIITHASFYSSGNGVFGPRTTQFHKELGHRLKQVSVEANKYAYFTQSLSVAIQRGNAASVLGTMKVDSEDEEFFCTSFELSFSVSSLMQLDISAVVIME